MESKEKSPSVTFEGQTSNSLRFHPSQRTLTPFSPVMYLFYRSLGSCIYVDFSEMHS